ncbi:N-6 DNA methylase [Bacillus sp. FJAT-50079]|uniref:Eco57I restriction-modification methylase domain-containing protein n=1 Tax=Bacillus sp. FJAT-50079 TaxID=2833577 RepID=UPI001BC9D314|nr:N-6 DNA methylase [Bacillus sp. FJAT-50079]MBS4207067.1 N-6 DNA methylase [Bacillus sp. FJAT-50079]
MATLLAETTNKVVHSKELLVESQLIRIFLNQLGMDAQSIKNNFLKSCLQDSCPETEKKLLKMKSIWTLKDIEDYFYSFLNKEMIDKNGIIFTPNFIVDYILSETIDRYNAPTICDFSCGCGAFLVRAAEHLYAKDKSKSIVEIIENHIFGVDLLAENVRGTKILLTLLAYRENVDVEHIQLNIICYDGLEHDVLHQFSNEKVIDGFDCVVGNPPYIKVQDLSPEVRSKLKADFKTTTSGSFNIYFAFIELGANHLKQKGTLGYIVPNHFLKLKSAQPLREFLLKERLLKKVIDFKDCQLFPNAQTYSAIITLDRTKKENISYNIITSVKSENLTDINETLKEINYSKVNSETINLLNEVEKRNVYKIENAGLKLKISTGIATQKDGVYMIGLNKNDSIEEDKGYYTKYYDGKAYKIETDITVPLIKGGTNIDHDSGSVKKKVQIIYPYVRDNNGSIKVIQEDQLQEKYPFAYSYLKVAREELQTRNGGTPSVSVWYEYGRSQALDSFGAKLISPTNSNRPKFTLFEETALFNNGYAIYGIASDSIFHDHLPDLNVLAKILNSIIMDYYIKLTSYMISGGYYCYQKKYINNFSIPPLSSEDMAYIRSCNDSKELDQFLIKKYDLEFPVLTKGGYL